MDKSTKTKSKSKTKSDDTSPVKSTANGSEGGASVGFTSTASSGASTSENGGHNPKSAIEMVEEATGSKRTSKKTKTDLKAPVKAESAPPKRDEPSESGSSHSKHAKEPSESKESTKDKKDKRKSKKVDTESLAAEIVTGVTSTPSKDNSTAAPSENGASTPAEPVPKRMRPKSMLIASPKDIEGSADSSSAKRSADKRKTSANRLSSNTPKTRTPEPEDDADRPIASPSKLKGPSRESSLSNLNTILSGSPSGTRRKSMGASSRSTIIASAGDSPKSQSPSSSSSKLDIASSATTAPASDSDSATALDAPTRAGSSVGEVRAMWEKKQSQSSALRVSPRDPTSSAPSSTKIEPSSPDSKTQDSKTEEVPVAISVPAAPKDEEPLAPIVANTTITATTVVNSTPAVANGDKHSSKADIPVSVAPIVAVESPSPAPIRNKPSTPISMRHHGRSGSASGLARSGSHSDVSTTNGSTEVSDADDMRIQFAVLKSVTTELTARLDALSIKFSFTLENVGRRLDAMDGQIKKLQADVTDLQFFNTAAPLVAGTRASADLSQSGSGHVPMGSISEGSPRVTPRRGISQKDLSAKRTNSSTHILKPNPSSANLVPPPTTTVSSPTSSAKNAESTSSTSSSSSIKDLRSFLTPMLVDLSTLKRTTTVPMLNQSQEALEKRERIVCEVLETELRYLFGLEVMIKNWELPLLAYAAKEPKVETSDVGKIFGEGWLQPMLDNNLHQLFKPLEERLMNWSEDTTIGDVFLKFERALHQYKRYCGSYEQSLRLLINMVDHNPKFKKALQFFDDHCVAFNGLRLRDYLITPVQRIPRYALLLRDLLASTPETHPDHSLLTEAIAKISDVANEINSHIRQAESQWKMAEIVGRGNGFEQLLSKNATRSFHKVFMVDVLVDLLDRRRSLPNRKHELLIFNDLIVSGSFVNKKALFQEFSIPTALTWVITDLTESPENLAPLLEDCPRTNAVLLRGPESLWLIGAKNIAEFNSILDVLQTTIGCPQSELAAGPRTGNYSFYRTPTGRFTGQWLDADFHGEGTYTKADGSLFQGHWDHRFKAGYGTIMVAGQAGHLGGWKNSRPEGDVSEYKDHQLWSDSERKELSDREWKLLMTRAKVVEYKQDQKVITQDISNSSLFKIKSGKCRVEKTTHEGKRLTLVTLTEGAYFGDTSVLPAMSKATADVICDTSTAEIAVIEVSVLLELLKTDPVLAMRFFRQLANTLANRLKSLHSGPAAPPSPSSGSLSSANAPQSNKFHEKRKRSESSGEIHIPPPAGAASAAAIAATIAAKEEVHVEEDSKSQVDHDYVDKFDLPSGEVLITSMSATLRGVMKKYAQLYLSQRYLCFEAKVFVTSRDVIPLERVTRLELVKKKYLLVHTRKSKFEFSVDNLEELYSLLSSLCSVSGAHKDGKGDHGHDAVDSHHLSAKSFHHADKSDDTATASSDDGRDRTGSNAGLGIAPKRRSTHMNLTPDEDSTDSGGGLNAADWNLLQQGFQCISFTKGMAIIQQGQTQSRLFQIAKGSCRIEIKNEGDVAPKVVGRLTTRDLFGEISFIHQGSAASASVVADDDTVELYVLEGHFLNILFVKYPDLAGRFFAYLAGVIAGRLNEREASKVSQERRHRRTRTKATLPSTPAPAPTASTIDDTPTPSIITTPIAS